MSFGWTSEARHHQPWIASSLKHYSRIHSVDKHKRWRTRSRRHHRGLSVALAKGRPRILGSPAAHFAQFDRANVPSSADDDQTEPVRLRQSESIRVVQACGIPAAGCSGGIVLEGPEQRRPARYPARMWIKEVYQSRRSTSKEEFPKISQRGESLTVQHPRGSEGWVASVHIPPALDNRRIATYSWVGSLVSPHPLNPQIMHRGGQV